MVVGMDPEVDPGMDSGMYSEVERFSVLSV